jgi:hypothetical protein
MTQRDEQFLTDIKRQLDREADTLDQSVQQRLRQGRAAALASGEARRGRLWLEAAAFASLLVVAVVLWVGVPEQKQQTLALDDMELLADSQEPEFYQELDFYYWLEQQNDQG